ncbi:MAG: NAD(P)H-dependent oxidoreductase subunit E [Gammaproteobacteria bacterium]
MLTDDERRHLEEHVAGYPHKRAGALYVLQHLQQKYGYLHDAALAEASSLVGLSATQLDELITFYPLLLRQPAGKTVVRICDSIACHLAGADALLDEAERLTGVPLGVVSEDQTVSVMPHVCLGLCDHAPAALVGDRQALGLDKAALAELIAALRAEGEG